jgi:hypothetical protein
MRYQIGGRDLTGTLSVNTMTHPDFRGQGVFMMLAEETFRRCAREGRHFTTGFPNENSHAGFLKHLAFQEIGRVPLWILPLRLAGLQSARPLRERPILRLLARLGATFWDHWTNGRLRRWQGAAEDVIEISQFDARFDTLWEKARSGYPNAVERSARYLSWRFAAHPTRRYRTFALRHGDRIEGFVVTRQSEIAGLRSGLLVDLFVERSADGIRKAKTLVRAAAFRIAEEGATLAGALALKGTPFAFALSAAGFHRCPAPLLPQPFPFIIRWNSDGAIPEALFDFGRWYITMGDYDAV